jgi:hypothetical protein
MTIWIPLGPVATTDTSREVLAALAGLADPTACSGSGNGSGKNSTLRLALGRIAP